MIVDYTQVLACDLTTMAGKWGAWCLVVTTKSKEMEKSVGDNLPLRWGLKQTITDTPDIMIAVEPGFAVSMHMYTVKL